MGALPPNYKEREEGRRKRQGREEQTNEGRRKGRGEKKERKLTTKAFYLRALRGKQESLSPQDVSISFRGTNVLTGQSSPGTLQSGQHASNGWRHIPHDSSLQSQVQYAISRVFSTSTFILPLPPFCNPFTRVQIQCSPKATQPSFLLFLGTITTRFDWLQKGEEDSFVSVLRRHSYGWLQNRTSTVRFINEAGAE